VTPEEALEAGNSRVRIQEIYTEFSPPANFRGIVESLLRSVPNHYLVGLSHVHLTNVKCLNRERRHERIRSRGKQKPVSACCAVYHYQFNGQPARIEIFVDNLVAAYRYGRVYLRLPLVRSLFVGQVLFHELGHHLGAIHQGCHAPNQKIAEEWALRLMVAFIERQFRWLNPLRPVLRFLLHRPVAALRRKLQKTSM
jgi:hypothetical protein